MTEEEINNQTEGTSVKEAAQKALQANKDHQYALKVYTERLEAELRTIDKMLDTADIEDEDEDEPELDAGGYVLIPNSIKAALPIPSNDFLSDDSPFREDAEKRTRYLNYTAIHPMKTKELEVLAEAVRTENHRKRALEAQKGGLPSFASRDDKSQDYFEWNTEGIDWDRVAEKVASVASLPRTARDCAIRWLGDRHPQFVHDSWTEMELEKLESFIKNAPKRPIDWVEIANKLGNNRTPLDCMRHAIHRIQHIWTPDSDDALLKAVNVYGSNNWVVVASHVSEDVTPQQCQNRYMRTLDPTIQRGNWKPEEDAQLRLAVTAYGNSWIEIADVIAGRTNDQCRDRWSDKINPKVAKGKWTDDEDKLLLQTVESLGTSSWKVISENLSNGRTGSNCRARYDKLRQKMKKPPKVTRSKSQTSQSPSINSVQTETQVQEAGPSSALARPRPRPRPRARKAPSTGEQQSTERPRPKPRPRARKNDEETPEKDNSSAAEGEPTPELESSIANKEKGKGRAIPAGLDKATSVRKRKSRGADNTGEAAPKRQRSTRAEPDQTNDTTQTAGDSSNEGVAGTLEVAAKDVSRPPVLSSSSAPQRTLSQDRSDVNKDIGEGEESASTVTNTTMKGKQSKRKVAVEPTRRQPSRTASKKSMS